MGYPVLHFEVLAKDAPAMLRFYHDAYVHANLAMKEKALGKVLPMNTPYRRFQADDRLLAFLESI